MRANSKNHTVKVPVKTELRVSLPKFVPSQNLKLIDKDKLDNLRSGSIVLGKYEVEGACSCSTTVTAHILQGKITSIETEKCENSSPFPKQFQKQIKQARKKLLTGRQSLRLPMRVSEFFRRGFIDIGGGCITICIFNSCFFCCDLDGTTVCGEPIIVKG